MQRTDNLITVAKVLHCGGRAFFFYDPERDVFFAVLSMRISASSDFFDIKSQLHLEEISVDKDLKLAALQLGQAFGDGQTQTAALGGARHITSDKTFGQFVRTDI